MLAKSGKRSEDSQAMIDYLRSIPFGMLIADEVQTVPAREVHALELRILRQ